MRQLRLRDTLPGEERFELHDIHPIRCRVSFYANQLRISKLYVDNGCEYRNNDSMASEFDRQVGVKIRRFRRMRGMTMEQLAGHLGVTFQQVQKYERGNNKVSFERLYRLSLLFEVPLTAWLADGVKLPLSYQRLDDRQVLVLNQAYQSIRVSEHRALLCALARALAEKEPLHKGQS